MRISDWSSDVCSSDLQWYRRGYYDDDTPLGSHESDECRIDTIAQSWSVIAGGGDPAHAESAMAPVDRQLILRDEKVALLFKIGRASCRDSVYQYVWISVVAVPLNKQIR